MLSPSSSPLPPLFLLSPCRDGQTALPSCSLGSCNFSCWLSSAASLNGVSPLNFSSPSLGQLSCFSLNFSGRHTLKTLWLMYPSPPLFLPPLTPESMVSPPPPNTLTPLPCQWSPLYCRALALYLLHLINAPHPLPSILHDLDRWLLPFFQHHLLISTPLRTLSLIPLHPLIVAPSFQMDLTTSIVNMPSSAFSMDPWTICGRTVHTINVPAATPMH